jgi:hypothetical protein
MKGAAMKNGAVNEGLPEALAELETLRDQIRLNVHLAGMDLRDEWKEIEKRLPDGQSVERLKEATRGAVTALSAEVRAFRKRLQERHDARAGAAP